MSAETILDLVSRLGLVDMVIDRVRARIEESDIDDVIDDLGAYIRRTPEAVVVGLGAATLAAGVLVFLNNRSQHAGHGMHVRDDREEPIHSESERMSRDIREPMPRPRANAQNTARKRSS